MSGYKDDVYRFIAEKYFKAEAKAEEKALEKAGSEKAEGFLFVSPSLCLSKLLYNVTDGACII